MRVTAEVRRRTRDALLAEGRRLFRERGYGATSTRDVARAAGIAAGTLFNYFETKEELAMSLVLDALSAGPTQAPASVEPTSAGEALFARGLDVLRRLELERRWVGEALSAALSPRAGAPACPSARRFQTDHLEGIARTLEGHGLDGSDPVTLHLYWTLFLGVLWRWAADESPRQEETLVLLDRSTRLLADGLRSPDDGER